MVAKGRVQKAAIESPVGAAIGQVEKDQQKILTLSLSPSDLSVDEILAALRPIIERAKICTAKRR